MNKLLIEFFLCFSCDIEYKNNNDETRKFGSIMSWEHYDTKMIVSKCIVRQRWQKPDKQLQKRLLLQCQTLEQGW